MLICPQKECTCIHHRIFDCLKNGLNEEAKSDLRKVKKLRKWTDTSGSTFLHYSVKYGNAEMTQHLIDEGCNVNAHDDSKVTPLMLAVKASDLRTTEILLKSNADIYATDRHENNSLELAFYLRLYAPPFVPAKQNSYVIWDMLLDRVNDDFSKGTLMKSLSKANGLSKFAIVVFGDARITRFILENGYPIDFRKPVHGYTALHCTVVWARLENAKILIEHGANVDSLDFGRRTPLAHYPGKFEDVDEDSEVLKIFLRCSTSLSIPNGIGWTAVEKLLLFGKEKTIRTVLLSDVDVDACISEEIPLLLLLIMNENVENLDFLDECDVKLDVNKRGRNGKTALMEAAHYGYPRKVDYLLHHGADVNVISSIGSSALSHAAFNSFPRNNSDEESDRAKIIELLLQHGADVQSFLSDKHHFVNQSDFADSVKVIVAHLAMLEPFLTDFSRDVVESNPKLKAYFDLCVEQLEDMRDFEVHGTVTLFNLLTEREDKLVAYFRNREFTSAWSSATMILPYFESYYLNTLQRRCSRGQELTKLREKVALAIEALTGLRADVYHAIVYKVISYLDHQDLRILCKIL